MESNPSKAGDSVNRTAYSNGNGNHHEAKFTPARDSRNRRVPGLYIRNGRYYTQLWVDLGNGKKGARRFPLVYSSSPVDYA